jgi:hypothetical protein
MERIKELKKKRLALTNEYVSIFEKKHNIKFEGWIGDEVGDVASFEGSLHLSFDEIYYDLEENVTPGLILEWSKDTFIHHPKHIRYKNYAKGLRYESL